MIGQAKKVLYSGPSALAPQVVGVSTAEAEQLIRDWIYQALSQLHSDPLGTEEQAAEAAPQMSHQARSISNQPEEPVGGRDHEQSEHR